MTTVGQSHSLTIGDFTLADVNNFSTNGGCSGIKLFDSKAYFHTDGDAFDSWIPQTAGGSYSVNSISSSTPGTGDGAMMVQAVDATPSYLTSDVGDLTGSTLPTGIIPCANVGGASGG